jgi:hypothetical protein
VRQVQHQRGHHDGWVCHVLELRVFEVRVRRVKRCVLILAILVNIPDGR